MIRLRMIGVAADGRVHGVEVDDGGLGVVVDILETRNMTKDKPRIFFKWSHLLNLTFIKNDHDIQLKKYE